MKKWIFIIVAVVIVGFVGYQWYSTKTSAQQTTTQIRTAVAQKGNIEVKISGSGTVQPVVSQDITATNNNNEIDEVLVTAGQAVKKGAELITFTDDSDPITAPADGVITSESTQAGQRVTIGQVVAHLTNYTNLQTVIQVDELDIMKVKKNQAVSIKVNAFPDQVFTGKVTSIADEGSSTNGVSTFDVTIHFDQSTNLKVGMSTEASILTASKDHVILVPIDAVHSFNNGKFVTVVSGDTGSQNPTTQQKSVKTGIANEDNVEITDGLAEGDVVRLPELATGTANTNTRMQSGLGGFGGMGGMGRQFRNNNGGENRSFNSGSNSGRSGN